MTDREDKTPGEQTVKRRLEEKTREARELCGCTSCQGGYEIGAKTIARPAGGYAPSSCMAAVLLAELLKPVSVELLPEKVHVRDDCACFLCGRK